MSGPDKAPPSGAADKSPSDVQAPPPGAADKADSSPRDEQAHDVLAAEEFAMPAPDPYLRHRPIALPDDPTGISEPHDVLAAEEFAMPATRPPSASSAASRIAAKAGSRRRIVALAALALGVVRRLRRRA